MQQQNILTGTLMGAFTHGEMREMAAMLICPLVSHLTKVYLSTGLNANAAYFGY